MTNHDAIQLVANMLTPQITTREIQACRAKLREIAARVRRQEVALDEIAADALEQANAADPPLPVVVAFPTRRAIPVRMVGDVS